MKYNLIALDLDGTALNPKNLVEPSTAEAVRDAQARGVRVVVSTGASAGKPPNSPGRWARTTIWSPRAARRCPC